MRNRARPAAIASTRVDDPVELPEELQIFAHAHALGEREIAGREPDVRGRLAALPIERVPADRHRPGIGTDHTEHHQQRRGLARAVRSEERDALPRVDDEIDAVDRARPPVVLHQAACFQHHFRHAGTVASGRMSEPTILAVDWSGARRRSGPAPCHLGNSCAGRSRACECGRPDPRRDRDVAALVRGAVDRRPRLLLRCAGVVRARTRLRIDRRGLAARLTRGRTLARADAAVLAR